MLQNRTLCVIRLEHRHNGCIHTHSLQFMNADELQQSYLSAAPRLYAIALGMLHDTAAAEDVTQDAFVGIWQRRERFEMLSVTAAKAYFAQMVRHKCLNRLRRTAPLSLDDDTHRSAGFNEPEAGANPEELLTGREALDRLYVAVEHLPAKQARAFSLFHFEGLDVAQVARHMNETEAYVSLLLSRARQTLKQQIAL